jgi:hypothetical protein
MKKIREKIRSAKQKAREESRVKVKRTRGNRVSKPKLTPLSWVDDDLGFPRLLYHEDKYWGCTFSSNGDVHFYYLTQEELDAKDEEATG